MEIKLWDNVYLACINNHTKSPNLPVVTTTAATNTHQSNLWQIKHLHRIPHRHWILPAAQGCSGWRSASLEEFSGIWRNMNVNEGRLGGSNNHPDKHTGRNTKHTLSCSASHLQLWYQKVGRVYVSMHPCTHEQNHICTIYLYLYVENESHLSFGLHVQLLHALIICVCSIST